MYQIQSTPTQTPSNILPSPYWTGAQLMDQAQFAKQPTFNDRIGWGVAPQQLMPLQPPLLDAAAAGAANGQAQLLQVIEALTVGIERIIGKVIETMAQLPQLAQIGNALPAGVTDAQAAQATQAAQTQSGASTSTTTGGGVAGTVADVGTKIAEGIMMGLDNLISFGGSAQKFMKKGGSFLTKVKDAFTSIFKPVGTIASAGSGGWAGLLAKGISLFT